MILIETSLELPLGCIKVRVCGPFKVHRWSQTCFKGDRAKSPECSRVLTILKQFTKIFVKAKWIFEFFYTLGCTCTLLHAKKFCSETTVSESHYKLVVTPQVVSVFIQIDLTKGYRSHCWLNLVSSMHYQSKKRGKQIQSGCGTDITNQR